MTAVIAAVALAAVGLTLVTRSITQFVRRGKGTLAPWDPTRVLIVDDIYRYTRNPMKTGLFLVLIAECLLLRSPALMVWTACFIVANVVYIRWHEEQGLRKRFGDDYEAYCRRVRRWLSLLSGQIPQHLSRPAGGPAGCCCVRWSTGNVPFR
jgi:protein-S-isoprenylcysteine O-methyltransferase Ste14